MFERFFVTGLAPYPLLWQQHEPWLVVLSVLMSISASIMALHMTTLARSAPGKAARHLAIFSGALALGAGIWAMHFVAMLSFELCAQGGFNLGITALSILPSMIAAWIALNLLMRPQLTPQTLMGGGLLVGAGIGVMHYVGMEAATLAPLMRYDPWMFAVSIVVAVVLGILALWIRFGLQGYGQLSDGKLTLLAGTIMGCAISGMHYTAMAALRFVQPVETLPAISSGVPAQISLSLAIAGVTLAMALLAVAINVSLRYRQMYEQSQRSESRLRGVVDTAVDGIIMINPQGIIQSFNSAAERMLGWRAAEVIGHNVNRLMPEPHHTAHDGYLATHLATGRTRIIGEGREVEAKRKDGSLLPIRLAVGRVELPDAPLFVGFLTDISARRAMESSLRHSEEQFRSLVGNIPGATFRCRFDADWSMLFISDAVQMITGWLADDFITGKIHFAQLIHPDDHGRVNEEISQALAQRQTYHIDYRLIRRDGQSRWVSESGRGVYDEHDRVQWIDGVILDISETKARNAEFEGTVAAINRALAVVEFDLTGHVLTANSNFLTLMGYRLEEIQGQPHRLFCTPEQRAEPAYASFWQRLAQGALASGEYLRLGKGQRPVWLQASYNPIFDAEGKVFKIIKFATDLSERRAMEQALRDAKETAEQAAAARSSFLANMSHEIRTPMNAIIGFSDALLETPLNAEQQRHLGIVQRTSRSMLRLLNDILDTAKLEKGAVELEINDFSLRDLCQQIQAALQITADKKGLALHLDYPEHTPDDLRGDALRLQQILMNLMGNAIKFTEHGQVTLRVRYREQPVGELLLEVVDTGIGIAPDQIERIFSPFAQADASTTRQFGGTGLGTTIARQLVELMQGEITIQSTLGQGSTFSVRLPLPKGQPPEARMQPAQPVLPSLHLLAVDDVADNLELLQLTLSRQGHHITRAEGGSQAIQCYQNPPEHTPFDLILMDLQMPEIDGLEATRRIRTWEREHGVQAVPIIALSASVLEEDQRNALAAGMDGFASKPLDLPQLYGEIARVLGLRPPASSTASHLASPLASLPHSPFISAAIDWERGLSLWQQKPLLHAAIGRFLNDNAAAPKQLSAFNSSGDPTALAALAHRLRGAAGNLALPHLQEAFAHIEKTARSADPARAPLLQQYLESVTPAWQAVVTAWQSASQPPRAPDDLPVNTSKPTPNIIPPNAQQQHAPRIRAALNQARACLARGELPDAALQTLAQYLPDQQLSPLRDALDGFDFPQAQALLHTLHDRLPPLPKETPP